jgi:hypothetical protein
MIGGEIARTLGLKAPELVLASWTPPSAGPNPMKRSRTC